MWEKKQQRGSRDLLHPNLGDKVDTDEGPVGDRRMSKLVLLVMRRKGGKSMETQWERKVDGGKQKIRRHRGVCIWQDGGQLVTKKQEQKKQDCGE